VSGARFLVSGRVQGVWFRASTREHALRLDLRGLARNLDDGRVEVIAFGQEDSLDKLEAWLAVGPPRARVETVLREPCDSEPAGPGFSVA
jgi:acylphosphatase